MRILYSNHTATVSGSERSLLILLEHLPAGVQALVACPPGRLAEEVARLGVDVAPIAATDGSLRVHPAHTSRAIGEISLAALQLSRLARRHRAEIVHANSIRAGIEVGLARLGGAAAVVSVRDCLPPGLLTSAAMRLIADTASTVVANSHYTAGRVRAQAPRAPLEVVHPAIDVDVFDPRRFDGAAARAALGRPGRARVLLGVVAQLSPWKGQETAVRTVALLRAQGVDAHLLLVGSAKFVARSTRFDNRAYVAGLHTLVAELGVGEHVSWLGERDDVPELLCAIDVLLLPSHEEPFGRAMLEALALEVPLVATSVGGPRELIRDGHEGYLADPHDPAAWARAIRRVTEQPGHGRELGRAGRRRVAADFGARAHVAEVLAMYERVLAGRRLAA
jgi:glycosyltransferase involved in cell wall biosynthesis